MKKFLCSLALVGVLAGFQSCKNDDDSPIVQQTDEQQVIENYADIVLAGYEDSHTLAIALKNAIDAFVANPSQTTMDAAKEAWYAAREPYGQTEGFRFTEDGPIDTGDNAVEGYLNAWPLDESFIDYVRSDSQESNVNIINNLTGYPTLTKEVLRGANEYGDEERNVAVGYHAIEFLLWGQDSVTPTAGAEHTTGGNRPYTDFVDGGTASNQDRRRQFLALTAEILVEDLQYLVDAWDKNGNNYRATFLAKDEDDAIRNILTGAGVLAGSELANERILAAVGFASQEDEHSCFSDNTHRDILLNFYSSRNIFVGSYTRIDGSVVSGKSIKDLLQAEDATKATEMESLISEIDAEIQLATVPFDYSITQAADIVIWNDVIIDLRTLGENFAQTAGILEVGTFPIE